MKRFRKRFDYVFSAWYGYIQTVDKSINIGCWEKWLGTEYTFVLKQKYSVEKIDKVMRKPRIVQRRIYKNINLQHSRKTPRTGQIWNDNHSRYICFRITETSKNASKYSADLEVLPKSMDLGYKISKRETLLHIMKFIEQTKSSLSETEFMVFMSKQEGVKKHPSFIIDSLD